jgi:outer membrane protein assembly factor BamA
VLALCACAAAAAQEPAPAPDGPPTGVGRWFDPATAPFIPVPEIDLDPYSGTTLGVIPVWLTTDAQGEITRILAPDVIHNPYFGWGARARIFAFPSADAQWSVVGGGKQRVEREFAAQYAHGLRRQDRFSFTLRVVYDRSGTPRFYGIGNDSREADQSNYTDQQQYLQAQLGWNISRTWQLALEVMPREVQVLPGTLAHIPSTDALYPGLPGLGTTRELLNRLQVSYDTRDDPVIPSRGTLLSAYVGGASRNALPGDSLYSEAGADARAFYSPGPHTTWALHGALRYMPTYREAPFWALSSLGGDESVLGGAQPLRGFGSDRFCDRNAFSASLELREQVAHFDAVSTHVELQLTPFVDLGRVFASSSSWPIQSLHAAVGLGVRAVARPFVVGYVDIGKGSEGVVAFSGINYPF